MWYNPLRFPFGASGLPDLPINSQHVLGLDILGRVSASLRVYWLVGSLGLAWIGVFFWFVCFVLIVCRLVFVSARGAFFVFCVGFQAQPHCDAYFNYACSTVIARVLPMCCAGSARFKFLPTCCIGLGRLCIYDSHFTPFAQLSPTGCLAC